MKKSLSIAIVFFLLGVFSIQTFNYFVKADTTPDSGVTSTIREVYNSLVTLGYGEETGDWGTIWNRIKSAAEWTPDGDVTAEDVKSGVIFYSDSRTQETGTLSLVGDATVDQVVSGATFYADDFTLQTGTLSLVGDATVNDVVSGKTFYSNDFNLLTGTAPSPIDFSLQQYSERDDFAGTYNSGSGPEDYQLEEMEWTNQSDGSDTVWKDEHTGVYWSSHQGNMSNIFTNISLNTCDFFNESLYPTRAEYPGGDSDCGNAINYCATLSFGGRTDWYLPTQKELQQAYMDGIYNKAGDTQAEAAAFTWIGAFASWSSSESSAYPTYAWAVYLYDGTTTIAPKTVSPSIRCVARD